MPLTPQEKQKRYRDRQKAVTVTEDGRPWEDTDRPLVDRIQLGLAEAGRTGRPVVVSAARGLVVLPQSREGMTGGPPSLSVFTGAYQRR